MVSTNASMAALSDYPVAGLAVVDEYAALPRHSFIQCDSEIVRIHWSTTPTSEQITAVAAIIGQNCDPVVESPEVLG